MSQSDAEEYCAVQINVDHNDVCLPARHSGPRQLGTFGILPATRAVARSFRVSWAGVQELQITLKRSGSSQT